jgi:hypothetical protein
VSSQSARVNFGWSLARTDSSRGWPPSYFELISIHYENGCLRCVPCPRRIVGVRWRQRAALGAGPDLNPELRFRVPRSSFAWAGFSVSQKLSPLQLSSSRALRTKNSQQSGPLDFFTFSCYRRRWLARLYVLCKGGNDEAGGSRRNNPSVG